MKLSIACLSLSMLAAPLAAQTVGSRPPITSRWASANELR
jgi:hypothetical protein